MFWTPWNAGSRTPVPASGARLYRGDGYFACAMMELNMEAFFDDYRILQLRVTTIPPSPSLSIEDCTEVSDSNQ